MKSDVYEPRYSQSIMNHDSKEANIFSTKKELLEFVKYNKDDLYKGMILYTLEPFERYCYDGKTINEIVDVTRKIPDSHLPSYINDFYNEYDYEYDTSFFNDSNVCGNNEKVEDKNKNIMIFIFVLIAIMNIAILINIFGNYNRDKQLLQEIERLEQKIEYLEDKNSIEQNILEFM